MPPTPQAAKRHVASIDNTDKKVVEVAGGYHELFFGPEKEAVITDLGAWLAGHISPVKA